MATTLDDRTRRAHAIAFCDLRTALRHAPMPPARLGAATTCARLLVFLAKRFRVMAVLRDRQAGATWQQIGRWLGMDPTVAERLYGPMEAAWRAGHNAPWAAGAPVADAMPIDPYPPAGTAPCRCGTVHTPRTDLLGG